MTGKNTVLITGGFGNLGSWLTDYFVKHGFDVTVLSHRKKDFLEGDYKSISCDITDSKACETALTGREFDYVVHTASVNDVFIDEYAKKALLVNALGTRNLLQAVKKDKLKNFVYLSSFHVYGAASGIISETTSVNPKHDYATTHLFAEYYVKQFHLTHALPFTILRLTNSYGCPKEMESSKWYLILNDLARMAFQKREIVLNSNGQAQRDFIWMGTVCNVIARILHMEKATNDIFNLGSGTTFRLMDVANAVQTAYAEQYGHVLPVNINEQDKTVHKDALKVEIGKILKHIPFLPENKFKEEAKKIFMFLEIAK